MPVGSYYFYFDHEDLLQTLCGFDLPQPLQTESNRLRLNFTTDSKIQAKGFQVQWKAGNF